MAQRSGTEPLPFFWWPCLGSLQQQADSEVCGRASLALPARVMHLGGACVGPSAPPAKPSLDWLPKLVDAAYLAQCNHTKASKLVHVLITLDTLKDGLRPPVYSRMHHSSPSGTV